MARAYIAIGSNLGDRGGFIELARRELACLPDSNLTAFSRVYETEPIGPPGQGKYLNAAAALETRLSPSDLLGRLRRIEQLAGRQRRNRWAARTLDLDLLLYDDRVIQTEELTVPHPQMHERLFVLEPLNEIAPQACHPKLRKTVRELLDGLRA